MEWITLVCLAVTLLGVGGTFWATVISTNEDVGMGLAFLGVALWGGALTVGSLVAWGASALLGVPPWVSYAGVTSIMIGLFLRLT